MSNINIPTNKNFGIVFFIFFILIFFYNFIFKDQINLLILFISLSFLILGVFSSRLLTPLNRTWMAFGNFLGKFLSPIIMFFIYFTVVLSTKIIMSLFKKDWLGLKIRNNDKSYWIKKNKVKINMDVQF